jgi:polyisoprenoid-binding protein YceI
MSTLTSPTIQEKDVYSIDVAHTTIEFVVKHMMISKVRGRFGAFEGILELAPGSDLPQAIDVTIEAASIDTREAQRDAHLRSPDFFEVERYAHLAFKSTRIEGTPADFKVYGDLTIHGVTRGVVLDGEFQGRGRDPWGGERVGFSATATINRKDFGLTWNQTLELGGVLVSDEIKIELNVEALRQAE